jgi:FAD/FMN-containing dehydrogenase
MSADGSVPGVPDRLVEDLAAAVGEAHVLVDDDVRAPFEVDWTGRYRGVARAVVRPADAEQVAAVLAACRAHGAAVVPQGGNTGMVGAGVPRGGEVVLSTARLTELGAVDRASAQVTAGAGVALAAVQAHAREAGLDAGVDLGARDSATVGGLVATDAGGTHAVRYGTVRARVAGLQAVLADGTIVDRPALLKDNAGYDLAALLVGSEGTLGVITAVRWRLVPWFAGRAAAFVPLPSLERAADLLADLRPRLPSLTGVDFLLDEGLQLVLDHLELPAPVPERAPVYVLLDCAAGADPTDELAAALDEAGIDDAVMASGGAERDRLWHLREAITEALSADGRIPHKMDVGVPLARLAEFAERVRGEVERLAPDARVILFGHLGDGNVHVNVLDLEPGDHAVDEAVLRVAAACEGTISAEHGVGVLKARWLELVRSPGELRAMAQIKRALDPDGLLNPGVMLP